MKNYLDFVKVWTGDFFGGNFLVPTKEEYEDFKLTVGKRFEKLESVIEALSPRTPAGESPKKEKEKSLDELWEDVEKAKRLHKKAMEDVLTTQKAYILLMEEYNSKLEQMRKEKRL